MKEYFMHDYHARADENIIRLVKEMGLEGYGIYWFLVEMLYENNGSLPADYDLLAYEMRAQCERIKKVCEGFALFYSDSGRLRSASVDRRLQERSEKSGKAKSSAMKRWSDNANALPSQCEGKGIKKREEEKREEEKTGEEKKTPSFVRPTLVQIQEYCRERGKGVDPERWISYYESNGWRVGRNPMKDWKAAVRTWESNGYNSKPQQSGTGSAPIPGKYSGLEKKGA